MRVAAQVEAEMAVVLMGIFGLRLCAQHDFVDQRLRRLALDASEHTIEMFGAHALALDELDAEGREKLAERADLLRARGVMGAVDQRRMRGLQGLGGGDIGQDHEFLDQPMRIEPFGPSDAYQLTLGIEDQLALGQVEIERIAMVALLLQQGIGRPERPQHAFEQWRRRIVGRPVDRALRLLVRELGGRAHHDAMELMTPLAAVRADDHSHRERRPVLVRTQRAEIV